MKKRIISLLLAVSFVLASALNTFAASAVSIAPNRSRVVDIKKDGTVIGQKTVYDDLRPTAITYKDLRQLVKIVKKVYPNKDYKIINARPYNNDPSTWIVRLHCDFENSKDNFCQGDFVINVLDYHFDATSFKLTSLADLYGINGTMDLGSPELKSACKLYGPCWYYFGLFDDAYHDICGFGLAQRIKRWPTWDDLTFNGSTYDGKYYTGSYTEKSDMNFLENHIGNIG